MIRIAALLTVHNRLELTRRCLESLFSCELAGISLEAFIVDDGSADGTAEFLASSPYPITTIPGDGNLYWNQGMRLCWLEAITRSFDYYLWLNNDVQLVPNAISRLIQTSQGGLNAFNFSAIAVGNCAEIGNGIHTYGAFDFQFERLPIAEQAIECYIFNGNIVLVPKNAVELLGVLSDKFLHSYGDFEYGLRAWKFGVPCLLSPDISGYCAANFRDRWKNIAVPLIERWKIFHNPTGVYPRDLATYLALLSKSHVVRGILTSYFQVLCPNMRPKL